MRSESACLEQGPCVLVRGNGLLHPQTSLHDLQLKAGAQNHSECLDLGLALQHERHTSRAKPAKSQRTQQPLPRDHYARPGRNKQLRGIVMTINLRDGHELPQRQSPPRLSAKAPLQKPPAQRGQSDASDWTKSR